MVGLRLRLRLGLRSGSRSTKPVDTGVSERGKAPVRIGLQIGFVIARVGAVLDRLPEGEFVLLVAILRKNPPALIRNDGVGRHHAAAAAARSPTGRCELEAVCRCGRSCRYPRYLLSLCCQAHGSRDIV